MRTTQNARYRVDYFDAAGWVTVVITELKTGLKAQATAGDETKAKSAAQEKLRIKNQYLRQLRKNQKKH